MCFSLCFYTAFVYLERILLTDKIGWNNKLGIIMYGQAFKNSWIFTGLFECYGVNCQHEEFSSGLADGIISKTFSWEF